MIQTLADTITINISDELSKLSDEEALALGGGKRKCEGYVFQSKEKHILFENVWKKLPLLASFTSTEQLAETTAKQYKSRVPGIKNLMTVTRTIGGVAASGFRYEYVAKDIEHIQEYVLIKHKKYVYAFIFTTRKSLFEANIGMFEEMLASVKIV